MPYKRKLQWNIYYTTLPSATYKTSDCRITEGDYNKNPPTLYDRRHRVKGCRITEVPLYLKSYSKGIFLINIKCLNEMNYIYSWIQLMSPTSLCHPHKLWLILIEAFKLEDGRQLGQLLQEANKQIRIWRSVILTRFKCILRLDCDIDRIQFLYKSLLIPVTL